MTLNNQKAIEIILRLAVFGEFLGHGVFALQGKKQWVGWVQQMSGADVSLATQLLFFVGFLDITISLIVLLKPVRALLLWAAFWGFWTALLRPLVGESLLDFIERWTNWGAPLALLLLLGWPKSLKGWFFTRR